MLRPTREPRGPLHIPSGAWTLLGVVGALLALLLGGRVGRWVAVGLALAISPRLVDTLARLPVVDDRRASLARALPWLTLAAVAIALLGELLLGHPPASRDHSVHYFQTRVLVDELLPAGELVGWSDSLNTGYPFGDSYPVIGYLLTGFIHVVSLGWISLRTSYAWGLLAVWLIALWGVAWLARTIAIEIERGRERAPASSERAPASSGERAPASDRAVLLDPAWAGALAGIVWLIDPGASREGGWEYVMFHGVWPQLLSSGLWIASLPATWSALRSPTPRRLALAGLLLGASVLAHPFGMLTAATSLAAWPLVLWATGGFSRLPPGSLRWGALIHLVAALVAAGGVLTFMSSADSMARSPVPWKSLGELAVELFSGELFAHHRAWVGPLALIGVIAALRRGHSLAWLALVLVAGLLVLGSDASITVLRLDLLVSGFKNLQFPRYAIGLKPVFFVFAGIGGALVLQRLRSLPSRDEPLDPATIRLPPRPAAARLLACLLVAPLVIAAFDDRGRFVPSPVGAILPLEGSIHEEGQQALVEALQAEHERLGRPPTVAFMRRGMSGGMLPLFAITDAGGKAVLDGHIPAVNYKYQVRRRSPEALVLLGVTHVLHDRPLVASADDRRLAEALEPIGQFGPWTLARLPAGEAGHAPFVAQGLAPEQVVVEQLSRREWVVRTEQAGRVQLALGPYRKWTITRDGQPYAPEPVALERGVPGLALVFERAGEVRLVYETPRNERVAGWITLAGLVIVLLALPFGRPLALVERLWSDRTRRLGWSLVFVVMLAGVVLGLRKQDRQLVRTWDAVLRDHRKAREISRVGEASRDQLAFVRDLVDAEAFTVVRNNPEGCDGLLGKDALAGCTQEATRSRLAMAYRPPYLYRCLRVVVQPQGWLRIELELADDEHLAGFMVREGRDLEGLEWRLPGREDFSLPLADPVRQHFHATAEGRAGETAIELRNVSDQQHALCFSLAAARSR